MRRVMVVLAALLLAGCTSSPSGTPATESAGATPTSASSAALPATVTPTPAAPPTPYRATAGERGCRLADLYRHFTMGGYATGSDFAIIAVANVSPTPCALRGPVSYHGLDSHGRIVSSGACPASGTADVGTTCAAGVSLVTHTPSEAPFGVLFRGYERDDPHQPNGLCRPQDEVMPTTLRLTVGTLVLYVRNYDPAASIRPFDKKGVYGCHGGIDLMQAGIGP
jgi:hypothetical protein